MTHWEDIMINLHFLSRGTVAVSLLTPWVCLLPSIITSRKGKNVSRLLCVGVGVCGGEGGEAREPNASSLSSSFYCPLVWGYPRTWLQLWLDSKAHWSHTLEIIFFERLEESSSASTQQEDAASPTNTCWPLCYDTNTRLTVLKVFPMRQFSCMSQILMSYRLTLSVHLHADLIQAVMGAKRMTFCVLSSWLQQCGSFMLLLGGELSQTTDWQMDTVKVSRAPSSDCLLSEAFWTEKEENKTAWPITLVCSWWPRKKGYKKWLSKLEFFLLIY